MRNIYTENWGLIPYNTAFARQQNYFDQFLEAKKGGKTAFGRWICCEHPPVITIGKHGQRANLLYSAPDLASRGVEVVMTDRGGDVTFHGPGQLVVYPILDLDQYKLGLRDYIGFLEEIVIRTIAEYGVKGERVSGASGVWIDKDTPNERKICAIGVKSSRYITMHGLALNVNTDLSYFLLIHPCGFVDKGVTSLSRETGICQDIDIVRKTLMKHAQALLQCDFFS